LHQALLVLKNTEYLAGTVFFLWDNGGEPVCGLLSL